MSFEEYMDQQLPTWRTALPDEVITHLRTSYETGQENRKLIEQIVAATHESNPEELNEIYDNLSTKEENKSKTI